MARRCTPSSRCNHIRYDSVGKVTGETNAAVDHLFGFTGREHDNESGLTYFRARYYDPVIGRFISEDPIGFAAGDVNVYRYVENSPTNAIDPSGLQLRGGLQQNEGRPPGWINPQLAPMAPEPKPVPHPLHASESKGPSQGKPQPKDAPPKKDPPKKGKCKDDDDDDDKPKTPPVVLIPPTVIKTPPPDIGHRSVLCTQLITELRRLLRVRVVLSDMIESEKIWGSIWTAISRSNTWGWNRMGPDFDDKPIPGLNNRDLDFDWSMDLMPFDGRTGSSDHIYAFGKTVHDVAEQTDVLKTFSEVLANNMGTRNPNPKYRHLRYDDYKEMNTLRLREAGYKSIQGQLDNLGPLNRRIAELQRQIKWACK